jgi:AcrR family transcriptional regulator
MAAKKRPVKRAKRTAGRPCLWDEYKRRSLHEAAIRLLCRHGAEALTMEALAREVGVAKGTLYLHVPDKQTLLDEVVQEVFAPLLEIVDGVLDGPGGAVGKLREYSRRYSRFFAENERLLRVLLFERRVTHAKLDRFRNPRYLGMQEKLARVLEAGVRAGDLRPLDARRAAMIFLEMNFALCALHLDQPRAAAPEADAELVSGLFLQGMERPAAAARKRRKSA